MTLDELQADIKSLSLGNSTGNAHQMVTVRMTSEQHRILKLVAYANNVSLNQFVLVAALKAAHGEMKQAVMELDAT